VGGHADFVSILQLVGIAEEIAGSDIEQLLKPINKPASDFEKPSTLFSHRAKVCEPEPSEAQWTY
jgi:hypothetical protein